MDNNYTARQYKSLLNKEDYNLFSKILVLSERDIPMQNIIEEMNKLGKEDRKKILALFEKAQKNINTNYLRAIYIIMISVVQISTLFATIVIFILNAIQKSHNFIALATCISILIISTLYKRLSYHKFKNDNLQKID